MVTNDPKLNDEIRILCYYGSEKRYYNKIVGTNSRLDELQARLLQVKLTHLDELNSEKHRSAEQYDLLINNKQVLKPSIRPNTNHIWHQYVVRCESRDELQNYLEANRIGTIIHYSIPMYNGMTQKEIQYVVDAINHFT